jgi:ABC-type iron transport system FetAB ATPase subunit
LLRIENLKSGPLKPLSFAVADGECLSIEGPSGTGKTRLLRAIADLDNAPGQVFLDGAERREIPAPLWRRQVRYCAAEPAWWTLVPRPAFPDDAQPAVKTRLTRMLHAVGLKYETLDQQIATLSTGERQRLALVRALIDEPKVLLLDEPTGALDPANAALVEELIRFQLLSGRSVLLVSHDPRQIERLAHARLQLASATPTAPDAHTQAVPTQRTPL